MFANVNLLVVLVASFCCQIIAQDSSATIVSWITTIYLQNVAAATLNSADQKVLVSTSATTFGLPASSVTYMSQGTAVPDQIVANMSVSVLLGDTAYTSAAILYGNVTAKFSKAVNNGDFENLLKANAQTNNAAPHLQSASAYPVLYTPYTTTEKINKDENLDLTEGGVAIIVICCLVMFFVVLYMAWGATHAAPHGDQGKPNATKGYAISEDEV